MLHIHHADDETRSASKAFADACWVADPLISSTWWHEVQGHTVGKIAVDWREQITQPDLPGRGCNLILASTETWTAVNAIVNQAERPDAFVTVLISDTLVLPQVLPTFIVWHAKLSATVEERQLALGLMEGWVKEGKIDGYGIVLTAPAAHPLHAWLEEAATAAAAVWERRKRSGLRLIAGRMDLLDLSLLQAQVTLHKEEPVSTLELAARLGLGVLITDTLLPASDEPSDTALAALMKIAEIEQGLNVALGGWPEVGGQRLFSVLAHLAQGQTPWPTPSHWFNWVEQIYPQLQTHWRQVERGEAVSQYLAALEDFVPHGAAMAEAVSQPLLEQVLSLLSPRLPLAWQGQKAVTVVAGLVTSIPGVSCLAVSKDFDPTPLMHLDTLADIGAILG